MAVSKGTHSSVHAENAEKQQKKLFKKRVIFSVMPVLIGAFFGFVFQRAHVIEPAIYRAGFSGNDNFDLLKMYMCTVVCTYIAFVFLYFIMPKKFVNIQKTRSNSGGSVFSAVVGGGFLAWGMNICGTCPLTVALQIGSLHPSAVWVMFGGVLGALFQGISYPIVKKVLSCGPEVRGPMYSFIENLAGSLGYMYPIWATVSISVLVGSVAYLDNNLFDAFLPAHLREGNFPYQIVAVSIGLTQAFLVYFLSTSLSSSSAYSTLAGQWLHIFPEDSSVRKLFRQLNHKTGGLDNWWMVIFMTAVAASAYFSAQHSGKTMEGGFLTNLYGQDPSFPNAIIGGAMMVFGGRTAGGCFFGHCVSGVSFASKFSLLVTIVTMTTFWATSEYGLLTPWESFIEEPFSRAVDMVGM